jgi:hypothetical protein
MEYRDKVKSYLENIGVTVQRIEQEGDTESVVCHISSIDKQKIIDAQTKIEDDLNSVVQLSDMFGMNVVIVESNDLE